jgi:hypothetical protein
VNVTKLNALRRLTMKVHGESPAPRKYKEWIIRLYAWGLSVIVPHQPIDGFVQTVQPRLFELVELGSDGLRNVARFAPVIPVPCPFVRCHSVTSRLLQVFQLYYKLAALVDHVALLVLNAAPRDATTHRQLCHFPCHWPKASTRSGGGLDANAYKEALLAATLDRDCTFVAELIGLLDCFATVPRVAQGNLLRALACCEATQLLKSASTPTQNQFLQANRIKQSPRGQPISYFPIKGQVDVPGVVQTTF